MGMYQLFVAVLALHTSNHVHAMTIAQDSPTGHHTINARGVVGANVPSLFDPREVNAPANMMAAQSIIKASADKYGHAHVGPGNSGGSSAQGVGAMGVGTPSSSGPTPITPFTISSVAGAGLVMSNAPQVKINLGSGMGEFILTRKATRVGLQRFGNHTVWSGHVVGVPGTNANLVRTASGAFYGSLSLRVNNTLRHFEVLPEGTGKSVVYERKDGSKLSPSTFSTKKFPEKPKAGGVGVSSVAAAAAGGAVGAKKVSKKNDPEDVIDVMCIYTSTLVDQYGADAMEAQIVAEISKINTVIENSNVPTTLNIVWLGVWDNYDDPHDPWKTLEDLSTGDVGQDLRAERIRARADLVQVYTCDYGECRGAAYQFGPDTPDGWDGGYSLITQACVGQWQGAKQMGFTFGLGSDKDSQGGGDGGDNSENEGDGSDNGSTNEPSTPYAYAYRYCEQNDRYMPNFGSVMAEPCGDWYESVPVYSNPDYYQYNLPLGADEEADNARALTENLLKIANFMNQNEDNFELECTANKPSNPILAGFQLGQNNPMYLGVAKDEKNGDMPCKVQNGWCCFAVDNDESCLPMGDDACYVTPTGKKKINYVMAKNKSKDNIPDGAIESGYDIDGDFAIYSAMCVGANSGVVAGKTDGGTCWYSLGGNQLASKSFIWVITVNA